MLLDYRLYFFLPTRFLSFGKNDHILKWLFCCCPLWLYRSPSVPSNWYLEILKRNGILSWKKVVLLILSSSPNFIRLNFRTGLDLFGQLLDLEKTVSLGMLTNKLCNIPLPGTSLFILRSHDTDTWLYTNGLHPSKRDWLVYPWEHQLRGFTATKIYITAVISSRFICK